MIWLRILSAAIGIPLVLAFVWLGDPVFSLVVAGAAIWGGVEFCRLGRRAGYDPPVILVAFLILLTVLNAQFEGAYSLPLVTAAAILSLVWMLGRRSTTQALENWAVTLAGVIYAGWFLSYFILLRNHENGLEWVFTTIFSTFAVDTAAYFVGSTIGRHRLWPSISPGKTWEGSVGGFIAGVGATVLLVQLLAMPLDLRQSVALGALIGIVSQVGDLVESLFKRSAHVKDASGVIPGHGGILDRVDSLMFPAVVVYYYAVWAVA